MVSLAVISLGNYTVYKQAAIINMQGIENHSLSVISADSVYVVSSILYTVM